MDEGRGHPGGRVVLEPHQDRIDVLQDNFALDALTVDPRPHQIPGRERHGWYDVIPMGEYAEQRGRRDDRRRLEQELGPSICSHPVVAGVLDQILEGEHGVESALIDIVRYFFTPQPDAPCLCQSSPLSWDVFVRCPVHPRGAT